MAYDVTRSRGEESKAAILAAARELFATRGYRGTSLAAIAEAAGLSQPGLLHHYRSRTGFHQRTAACGNRVNVESRVRWRDVKLTI